MVYEIQEKQNITIQRGHQVDSSAYLAHSHAIRHKCPEIDPTNLLIIYLILSILEIFKYIKNQ